MLSADEIAALQRRKLATVLREILPANRFYSSKFASIGVDAPELSRLPFTTRQEIEQDQQQNPPYGTNLTYPMAQYCRYHQTSGTSGQPVRWLDTRENWDWFMKCWEVILRAAELSAGERLMFPFSFGPFIGFWAAFESASKLGFLCLPAGGMTTSARLRMLLDNEINIVFCTPTYALHLAQTAAEQGIDLANSKVRALIVAGEPGGSIPEVRRQIETSWGARVYDHNGMTEIGSVGFECTQSPGGLHVIESEFIAEVIDPQTGASLDEGQTGELVLTNLGRLGSPLIRYRTGDLVTLKRGKCACGRELVRLEGGILDRVDNMFIVRGNNVFPTAVEAVLRRFAEISEFRVCVRSGNALTQVRLEVEPVGNVQSTHDLAEQISREIQATLSFRADVKLMPPGTLPRFEMKAKRFVRES